MDVTESGDKTVKSAEWTSDDECLDAVVKGNAEPRVGREIFVRCGDMTFQVLGVQPNDRQHRAGYAHPALDRINNDAWFEKDDRKGDLCTRSSEDP